ncbi:MAG: tRNA lysidine(34) synthetase TilS [Flavisolibacter sp.]
MTDKKNNLQKEFTDYFENRMGLSLHLPYAVAISGGIDSVVLTELCHLVPLHFFLVHCNFNLRGQESKRDEDFVNTLAIKYKVPIHIKSFDTHAYANEHKLSVQEAARNLRYEWFMQLHLEKKSSYTLLGHHGDDNIETVLINFFRGTGLSGLRGMPETQSKGHCLRPLLNYRRQDIESFAKERNLTWMEDSSNKNDKYTRNFFRNTLIPQISEVFPQAQENILHNIERLKKTEILYDELLVAYKKKIGKVAPSGAFHLPVQWLASKKNSSLIYEIIKDYGFSEKRVDEVIKLLDSDSGKYISNERFKIIRHNKWLVIASHVSLFDPIAIDETISKINFDSNGQLLLSLLPSVPRNIVSDPLQVQLDAAKIQWPLLLRKWKPGDYFYPLGMKKKKKLSRFFIDQKLPKNEKERVWVLESSKRIIWVVGFRIDDRFKIMNTTKKVLQLTLSSP